MGAIDIRVLAIVEASSITGVAKAILEFAREAAQKHVDSPKIELSIMVFRRRLQQDTLTEAIRKAGIELDVVFERGSFDQRIVQQMKRFVGIRRPDVLWSNSFKSHFLVRLARLNRSAKWVAFHHGYTWTDMKTVLYNQFDRWSLPAADHVLTPCRYFARQLLSRGISEDHVSVQHMPIRPFVSVDSERIDRLRNELGLTDQTRVVLSVGRLSREKGHVDLIRAFGTLLERKPSMPLQLVVVGEGPERSKLEALCDRLNLSKNVRLVGQQSSLEPYYALANLFVLASHSEGSPNVLLEAMAAGVPVVVTRAGGIPEIATDQVDALFVEKQNVNGLADGIQRMLEDGQLRKRLGQAGKGVLQRHRPESYYRSMVSIFQKVLSQGGACVTSLVNNEVDIEQEHPSNIGSA